MTRSRRPEKSTGSDGVVDTGRYLVAQALADVVNDTDVVLKDETSRTIIRDAYHEIIDDRKRSELERTFSDAATGSVSDESRKTFVRTIIDTIHREMSDMKVRATLFHDAKASISIREVALYNFAHTREPHTLENIPLTAEVRSSALDGAELVSEGRFADGIKRFEVAIDAAETVDDAVTPRVLAAWAYHWSGEDARSLDYLEEALSLHYGAQSVRLAAAVADHNSPDRFREGTLSARAYLRILASVPPKSDVVAAVGFSDDGSNIVWEELSGDLGLLYLPRLEPETWVRIQLTGPLDAMPGIQAYYLAIGIVDEANGVPRNVEHQLLSGPLSADAVETIRFELP